VADRCGYIHHYDNEIKDSEEKQIEKVPAVTVVSLLAGVVTYILVVVSVDGTGGGVCVGKGPWYGSIVGHPMDPIGHGQLWYMHI
jgi:hypothetical protein